MQQAAEEMGANVGDNTELVNDEKVDVEKVVDVENQNQEDIHQ